MPGLVQRPWSNGDTLGRQLADRGVSRRDFLEFCGSLSIIWGLGNQGAKQVARSLQAIRRPSVIWIQLQACTGCVESVLRSAEPTIGDLVLDLISLDDSHIIMAASGHAAEKTLADAMTANKGKYILIVTGSVPLAEGGIYLTIGATAPCSAFRVTG